MNAAAGRSGVVPGVRRDVRRIAAVAQPATGTLQFPD